jgi:hypothetical protein
MVQCLAAAVPWSPPPPLEPSSPLNATAAAGEAPVVSVYLATDAAWVREELATRLAEAVKERPGFQGRLEVDYFRADLTPAHYFTWTFPDNEMKEVDQAL